MIACVVLMLRNLKMHGHHFWCINKIEIMHDPVARRVGTRSRPPERWSALTSTRSERIGFNPLHLFAVRLMSEG
jgi:hypothetical protein